MFFFLEKKYKKIDRMEIFRDVLSRRGYVRSFYKGFELHTKGFVFLIFKDDVSIGIDCYNDRYQNNTKVIPNGSLTDLLISLAYFENINK